MNTSNERLQKVFTMFPQLQNILKQLADANVFYNIGGSASLYIQGNDRTPHDIDIMFTDKSHEAANKVFGLKSEIIKRPNVSMVKSTPVDDGSVDFLSRYAAITDGRTYCTDPLEIVTVGFDGTKINLVPAEKIAVFKLIGRRSHHNDLSDFVDLFSHPDFDKPLFWDIVDSLDARTVVSDLLNTYKLN
jgi:hypothetical protein